MIVASDLNGVRLELRNEIHVGDEITFILPMCDITVSLRLPRIINAATGECQPKMSAGQHNTLFIPREWFGNVCYEKLVPYVLAYKRK